MRRYRVRITREAAEDVLRLARYFLERDAGARREVVRTLDAAFRSLSRLPFASRVATKDRPDPTLRELVVPFGSSGYVVLFRVTDARTVTVLAARHQREEDYH